MENNRDVLEMVDLILCNNTSEQIKEADNSLPDKDAIQVESFALLNKLAAQKQIKRWTKKTSPFSGEV